ncbi:predicted protein [Histoplasma mississippiense (nom. inval.)]|uniref:predicted protein n=1 Tax=Ajellomyces capsulatus (strain NAm1 / WU24) TaxID=2059318 RepID=UPI000157C64C|nr:predicted protein [Histoplasma mississippiense (nom. inval.)]EDN08100.1 predicted protein [Histoplasma mississippiense (nom. inval.)]
MTVCDDSSDPDWQPLANNVRIKPSENTSFVVVDIRNKQGASFVNESENNEYVGGVGTDEQGNVVMIPWNHGWYYYTIGSLRIGLDRLLGILSHTTHFPFVAVAQHDHQKWCLMDLSIFAIKSVKIFTHLE